MCFNELTFLCMDVGFQPGLSQEAPPIHLPCSYIPQSARPWHCFAATILPGAVGITNTHYRIIIYTAVLGAMDALTTLAIHVCTATQISDGSRTVAA